MPPPGILNVRRHFSTGHWNASSYTPFSSSSIHLSTFLPKKEKKTAGQAFSFSLFRSLFSFFHRDDGGASCRPPPPPPLPSFPSLPLPPSIPPPTLSLGIRRSSEPCLRKTLPADCEGLIPTPSLVIMAEVAGGTLNCFFFTGFFCFRVFFVFSRLRKKTRRKKKVRQKIASPPFFLYLLGGILEHGRERRGLGDAEPVQSIERKGERREERRRKKRKEVQPGVSFRGVPKRGSRKSFVSFSLFFYRTHTL